MRRQAKYVYDDTKYTKALGKLKELLRIVEETESEFDRISQMRAVFRSYDEFKTTFYMRTRWDVYKKTRLEEFNPMFEEYKDQIIQLGKMYQTYEKQHAFDIVKQESKFFIPQAGDIDARAVIDAYIYDEESFDPVRFTRKNRISQDTLKSAIKRIQTHDPERYAMYLKAEKENKVKRLKDPFDRINQIIAGIITGKTKDGDDFNVCEFYKLAPFKGIYIDGKDFDIELRTIMKDSYPVEYHNYLKTSQHYRKVVMKGNKRREFTYAEELIVFTCGTMGIRHGSILKKYMEENNISKITPVFRAAIVNKYASTINPEITKEDAEDIFDIMDAQGYPKSLEVFEYLKNEKLASAKDKAKALEFESLKLIVGFHKNSEQLEIVEEENN